MALLAIRAHFTCDGCGSPMSFDMDSAYCPPSSWSLFDAAVDAVRGGNQRERAFGCTSVQGSDNKCLCSECTVAVDAIVPDEEDRNATDAEIEKALDASLYAKPAA